LKLLFICHSIHPVISPRSFRSSNLLRYLLESGYQVRLIYFDGDATYFKQYGDLYTIKLSEFNISVNSRILKLFLDYFFYYPFGFSILKIVKAMKLFRKDLSNRESLNIISIAAPHSIHWAVSAFIMYNSIKQYKWLADCGDPFWGLSTKIKRPIYFKILENLFLKRASMVTIPLEAARHSYNFRYIKKITILPQLFFIKEDRAKVSIEEFTPNKIPVCGFAGTIKTIGRDIEPYLKVIYRINEPCEIYIYTSQINLAEKLKIKLDCSDSMAVVLKIKPLMDRFSLLKEFSLVDFMIDIPNKNPNQMPSKLIDYEIIGRPYITSDNIVEFEERFRSFLGGDYSSFRRCLDLDEFDIEVKGTVIKEFFSKT